MITRFVGCYGEGGDATAYLGLYLGFGDEIQVRKAPSLFLLYGALVDIILYSMSSAYIELYDTG